MSPGTMHPTAVGDLGHGSAPAIRSDAPQDTVWQQSLPVWSIADSSIFLDRHVHTLPLQLIFRGDFACFKLC